MFNLSPTTVARSIGVSRCYVSRILSDADPFVGNAQFYRNLEAKLGSLIESRQTQFFRVPPTSIRRIEGAVELASI
jgi:transcriptional regulator with XRE-family HTH domain